MRNEFNLPVRLLIITCFRSQVNDEPASGLSKGLLTHASLAAVTHAPFHASMLRPASQAGPMHEAAGVGKLVNPALLSTN